MYITTERLIIREFEITDVAALLAIKNDSEVLHYHPGFIDNNAGEAEALDIIKYFIEKRDTGDFSKEIYYAVCLRELGEVIGAITVSIEAYLRETQIGWMFRSEHCRKGYASEAGKATSDYILEKFGLEYMIVTMDDDNPVSFRTAQKSGFRLFDKRVPYDYFYSSCNVEDPGEVYKYFEQNQAKTGSCYYYFRKYNSNSSKPEQFYGDTLYTGRFA